MPEDNSLVPHKGRMPATETTRAPELEETLHQMGELLDAAMRSLMFQSIAEAETAARRAHALYDAVRSHTDKHTVHLLALGKDLVSLFTPLTRALCFQVEGRFLKARDEVMKGQAAVERVIHSLRSYAALPDSDQELLGNFEPMLSIMSIMFKGVDAAIRADSVGYQGRIGEYTRLLRRAVEEFRKVDDIAPSSHPLHLALKGCLTAQADRLETRIDVFGSQPEQRYLSPTGDKIFLIHGHDEAKWRELRDLLERRLKLKTLVLKDEPGAGETLIQKFERHADECTYAFALLTPDDFVQKNGKSYLQARPNVLFEIGWFYGHFGRDRVCIVKKSGTRIPSDLDGILSIEFQDAVEEGFMRVQSELKRAGLVGPKGRKLPIAKQA